MNWLVAALAACVLVPIVHGATGSVAWCYHDPSCNDTTWPTIVPNYCNGTRQSPINIVTESAAADSSLTGFTFSNFDNTTIMTKIENTGKTVKVSFQSGVEVRGGGLPATYNGLQFHLHWGDGVSVPGSEHTVDGKQYPMEFHIVNLKSTHNGNLTEVLADSTGIAALGYFIEARNDDVNDQPAAWATLVSYLDSITEGGQSVSVKGGISLNDLLPGVDTTKYFRYLGSLTTPTCNEAVVWTVFKESVKVSKNLINRFSTALHISNSSSPLMTDVFRNVQSAQPVTTQAASSSTSQTYSLGLMALSLIMGRS